MKGTKIEKKNGVEKVELVKVCTDSKNLSVLVVGGRGNTCQHTKFIPNPILYNTCPGIIVHCQV